MAEKSRVQAKTQESKQKCSNSYKQNTSYSSSGSSADRILQLQKTAGNQAVQRLIKSRALQAKLKIGQPNDIYEQEADRVAEQVMRMPDPVIQRKSAECDKGERKILQTRESREQASIPQSQDLPPIIKSVLSLSGQPLDSATRTFMEQRFGYDFSRVRVHSGPAAEQSARAVDALAYTVGQDIVFSEGAYAPQSLQGSQLLAHELAHVMYRQTGRPQLFRKEAIEPHYPTEEEQREIEKRLSREFSETEMLPPSSPGKPAVKRGRSLNREQIQALAARLKQPYFSTLNGLDSGLSASSSTVSNEAEAFSVVMEAREAILKRFGSYASRSITLTQNKTATPHSKHADDQILVTFHAASSVVTALARTVATTHCRECLAELEGLDDASRKAVIDALVYSGFRDRGEQLKRIATARVPGSYNRSESRASLRLKPREELYKTAVHELIHALAHPAFHAAFGDEDNINEGFTEYFTQQIVGSVNASYEMQYEKVISARDAMKGPFHFATVGGEAAEESMRLAYFRGRLDLIGWRPSGPEEEKAVKEVDESTKPWDATTARRYAVIYQAQAQAKQGASRNVIGMGLYFTKGSDDKTVAVRYARVLARTEPYAKGQLLLEGQLLGSPIQNPSRLGASLGIAVEYQEPYIYAGSGVRLIGTAVPASGGNRLDVSPFVSVGIRAWQIVRVGAEGFVLLPLTGKNTQIGGGITLGVEFK